MSSRGLKLRALSFTVGITKDGHPIVWHDEKIDKTKCQDTQPATAGDPLFPYVGRNVANLTLAQIKTLDCGSLRLNDFPLAGKSVAIDTPGGRYGGGGDARILSRARPCS